ncbi:MAG: DNA-3-methyladenine glycosylase I [Sandaracinaceae bacterium]|nr:DNA-3-methyladenine glycosylase I [Sandaracinaceae bacterium]
MWHGAWRATRGGIVRAVEGLKSDERGVARCAWCTSDPLYVAYHDREWGRPTTDDHRLFEKICLEGFQSGLSWLTILKKRERFRKVFCDFDFAEVARFGARDVERLLADPGIIRHRGKIEATIHNAGCALALREREGSLAEHLYRFVPPASERPKRLTWAALKKLAKTPASERLAKDLKKRGWRFFGPTTAYAFMQAMGLVNDHVEGCALRGEVEAERARSIPRLT